MVLRLEYQRKSFLFTGDLEAPGEAAFYVHRVISRSTILKVPHHGSHTSSSLAFVEASSPRLAVISLGYRNRFHFPAPEVVDRYRSQGARIMRTDDDGAIEVDVGPTGASIHGYRSRIAGQTNVR